MLLKNVFGGYSAQYKASTLLIPISTSYSAAPPHHFHKRGSHDRIVVVYSLHVSQKTGRSSKSYGDITILSGVDELLLSMLRLRMKSKFWFHLFRVLTFTDKQYSPNNLLVNQTGNKSETLDTRNKIKIIKCLLTKRAGNQVSG